MIPHMLRAIWKQVKSHWDRTDTLILVTNGLAFLIYTGNCWWDQRWLSYAVAGFCLALQAMWAIRRPSSLREALLFGLVIGALWPLGEGVVGGIFGWWGKYEVGGLRVWHTPLYAMLICWHASAHIAYVGHRTHEYGYRLRVAIVITGLTAFMLGLLGENYFVAAGVWSYVDTQWQFWAVPAFIPISYGLGYAAYLPIRRRLDLIPTCIALAAWTLTEAVLLGVLTGFFPRR